MMEIPYSSIIETKELYNSLGKTSFNFSNMRAKIKYLSTRRNLFKLLTRSANSTNTIKKIDIIEFAKFIQAIPEEYHETEHYVIKVISVNTRYKIYINFEDDQDLFIDTYFEDSDDFYIQYNNVGKSCVEIETESQEGFAMYSIIMQSIKRFMR